MASNKNSNRGEGNFAKTAANLARKGKTNKKLKSNPTAMKYEMPANKAISDEAKKYTLEHPKGTGYKYRNK